MASIHLTDAESILKHDVYKTRLKQLKVSNSITLYQWNILSMQLAL